MNRKISLVNWQPLAEALRRELQEYGGLVNLLEEQQRGILGQDPEGLMEKNFTIESQIEATDHLLKEREEMVHEIARESGHDEDSRLSQLLPFFPQVARPLLTALIDECLIIVEKIHRRVRQNQLLLMRAREVNEEIMRVLQPQKINSTYSSQGHLSIKADSQGNRIEVKV